MLIQHCEANSITGATTSSINAAHVTMPSSTTSTPRDHEEAAVDTERRRHALAVAMASTAAAQAAVATAQAAMEVVRLARPSTFVREHYAAIVVQTAFRGYLVCINVYDFIGKRTQCVRDYIYLWRN